MPWTHGIFSSTKKGETSCNSEKEQSSDQQVEEKAPEEGSLRSKLPSFLNGSNGGSSGEKREEEMASTPQDSVRAMLPSFLTSSSKGDNVTSEEKEGEGERSAPPQDSLREMLPSFFTSSSKGDNLTSKEQGEEATEDAVIQQSTSTSDEEKFIFDPNYKWPNLFKEADDMLQASLLIYAFADLRRLARKGILVEGTDRAVFELPMPALTCMQVIEQNEEALAKFNDEEDIKICREALRAIHERCEVSEEGLEIADDMLSMSTLEAFGDDNSNKELVYAIGVDKWYKRITVAFRGSVTQNDFITDACISMVSKPNPVLGFGVEQDEEIKLHSGFYEYMMDSKGKEREISKFDEVMGIVVPLLEKYPGFKLYVTGHSLGGALATLFSFEAVTSQVYDIPSPVTCVSVASPKLGNESFRKAHRVLEEQGELRHLRIANEMDPVTLGPPASSKVMLASLSPAALMVMSSVSNTVENELYKHAGMRLKLLSDAKKKYKLSFSTGSWKQDLFHPAAAVSVHHHFGYEYSTRMLRTKNDLEALSLNDVYKGKGLTSTSTAEKKSTGQNVGIEDAGIFMVHMLPTST